MFITCVEVLIKTSVICRKGLITQAWKFRGDNSQEISRLNFSLGNRGLQMRPSVNLLTDKQLPKLPIRCLDNDPCHMVMYLAVKIRWNVEFLPFCRAVEIHEPFTLAKRVQCLKDLLFKFSMYFQTVFLTWQISIHSSIPPSTWNLSDGRKSSQSWAVKVRCFGNVWPLSIVKQSFIWKEPYI